MKKIIFVGITVTTIVIIMALNVNFSTKNNSLSSISLANIETLAIPESVSIACLEIWGCCGDGCECKGPEVRGNW